MDIIDVSWLLDKIIWLTELDTFNYTFKEVGYKTTNFIIELGVLFFIIVVFPIVILVRALLRRFVKNKKDNCLTKRLRKSVNLRAIVLRFLLEGCIELGLVAMICVRSISKESFGTW